MDFLYRPEMQSCPDGGWARASCVPQFECSGENKVENTCDQGSEGNFERNCTFYGGLACRKECPVKPVKAQIRRVVITPPPQRCASGVDSEGYAVVWEETPHCNPANPSRDDWIWEPTSRKRKQVCDGESPSEYVEAYSSNGDCSWQKVGKLSGDGSPLICDTREFCCENASTNSRDFKCSNRCQVDLSNGSYCAEVVTSRCAGWIESEKQCCEFNFPSVHPPEQQCADCVKSLTTFNYDWGYITNGVAGKLWSHCQYRTGSGGRSCCVDSNPPNYPLSCPWVYDGATPPSILPPSNSPPNNGLPSPDPEIPPTPNNTPSIAPSTPTISPIGKLTPTPLATPIGVLTPKPTSAVTPIIVTTPVGEGPGDPPWCWNGTRWISCPVCPSGAPRCGQYCCPRSQLCDTSGPTGPVCLILTPTPTASATPTPTASDTPTPADLEVRLRS